MRTENIALKTIILLAILILLPYRLSFVVHEMHPTGIANGECQISKSKYQMVDALRAVIYGVLVCLCLVK